MSCNGKPCSRTTFRFISADLNNLSYIYTSRNGRTSTGILGPRNTKYRAQWYASLYWRLFCPPFSGIFVNCEDGCDCHFVADSKTEKTYTYTASFTNPSGSSIKITGKFTMELHSKIGICVPKNGTSFQAISDKDEFKEFIMYSADYNNNDIDSDFGDEQEIEESK